MAAKNDITLDTMVTKVPSKKYLSNYDNIDFSVKLETPAVAPAEVQEEKPEDSQSCP